MADTRIQVLGLGGTTQILRAALDILGFNTLSKLEAVRALSEAIDAGRFDLQTVRGAIADRAAANNPAQAAGGVTAVTAVAVRAENTALKVTADLAALCGEVAASRQEVTNWHNQLERSIYALRDRADFGVSEYNRIDLTLASISKDLNGAHASAARAENLAAQAIATAQAQGQGFQPDPAQVAQAVAQAVAAAFRPFEQAVVDAGAQAQVGALVAAQITGTFPASQVFGVPAIDSKLKPVGFSVWDHPEAPSVDKTYIWTEPLLLHLAYAECNDLNLWFFGAKGTGKTIAAQQFAARTGRKFVRINFNKYTEPSDFLGGTGILNGNTEFQLQDFLSAYTTPGAVILLDEVSMASAGCLAPLHGLLEPHAAISIGGKVWRKAYGCLIMVADNTAGNGDDSGRYTGTQPQNSAFGERFAASFKFDYLSIAQETQAVVNHTGCNPALAAHILGGVTLARAQVETGDIVDAPSIRCVIAYIKALAFMSPARAWASCIAARQPVEGQVALEAIRLATIDESVVSSLI
jgi:cobaltochelatase CobS